MKSAVLALLSIFVVLASLQAAVADFDLAACLIADAQDSFFFPVDNDGDGADEFGTAFDVDPDDCDPTVTASGPFDGIPDPVDVYGEWDSDYDGFSNDQELNNNGDPNDADITIWDRDGDGIFNGQDFDIDGDGVPNVFDSDMDGDGIPNSTDPNIDSDPLVNSADATPSGTGSLSDIDGDGTPNSSDADVDGDGTPNGSDADVDGDGIVNTSDADLDGDGAPNASDSDSDGDGQPNTTDTDDNADGVVDSDNAAFTISPASLAFYVEDGASKTLTFTVTNTGLLDLSNIVFSTLHLSDSHLSLTLPSNISTLAPGASVSRSLRVQTDSGFVVSALSGTLVATSAQGASFSVPVTLSVQPLVCPVGNIGGLSVEISSPDDDDEFSQGDTITLEVDVENSGAEDSDVFVEAVLYNLDDGRSVASVRSSLVQIDADDEETFTLDLLVSGPAVSDDDSYAIYVRAYEDNADDEQCQVISQDVEIDQKTFYLVAVQTAVHPQPALCGEQVEVDFQVRNEGKEEVSALLRVISPFGGESQSTSVVVAAGQTTQLASLVSIPATAPSGTSIYQALVEYEGLTLSRDLAVSVACADASIGALPAYSRPPTASVVLGAAEPATESGFLLPVAVLALFNVLLLFLTVSLAIVVFSRQ